MPIVACLPLRLEVSSSERRRLMPDSGCSCRRAISVSKRQLGAGFLFLASIISRQYYLRNAHTLSHIPVRHIQPACLRHEQLLSWNGPKREPMSESPRLVARVRKSKGKGLRTRTGWWGTNSRSAERKIVNDLTYRSARLAVKGT